MSTPQQAPQGYYAPQPPAAPRNGLGTAALVLGIIAAIFAFIPLFGIFIAIPLAALAVILGAVGIARAAKGKASNRGVAISGTTLGAVAIVLTIVMTAAVFNAADSVSVAQSGTSGGQNGGDGAGGGQAAKAAGIGDPVRDGKFEFTVTKVEDGVRSIGSGFLEEEAQGQFVLVHLRVKNIGDQAQYLSATDQYLFDTTGKKHSADDTAWAALEDNPLLEQINPGNQVKGTIVFDVPKKTKLDHLELHDSPFSGGVTLTLK